MATTPLQMGTAPANAPACITAAEQFIAIGGRLLINPRGKFEYRIDLDLLIDRAIPADLAAFRFRIARRLKAAVRNGGAVARIKRHIRERGQPHYGWFMLGGC